MDNFIVLLECELIPRANDALRSLFRSLWEKSTGKRWKNRPEDGQDFISSTWKSIWTSATCRQKQLIKSGNVNLWNLKLLNHILQKMESNEDYKTKIRKLSDAYDALRGKTAITQAQYNVIKDAVDELSTTLHDLSEDVENVNLNDDDETILSSFLACNLQRAGQNFLEQKQYTSAIDSYTEAIKLPKLKRRDLAELYVDRCKLYLEEPATMSGLMMLTKGSSKQLALEDAKRAVQLYPKWIKGYLSMGSAYYALNKHEKALNCIGLAAQLGELPPEIAEIREKCREIVESKTIGGKKHAKLVYRLIRMGLTLEMFEEMDKVLKDRSDPIAIVWQAHRCMLGLDREKNCELGIELYTQAATAGNAEAKYSLGMIYREGEVVDCDLKRSVELLEDAASAVCKRGMASLGVSEAQFELGIMRLKAKGVSRDYEKAVDWLVKSSKNGNKMAASVLGNFYLLGNCVDKDEGKAVQFWKLGAQRYNVISMQNLAEYYITCDVDPDKALEWHRRAIESGFVDGDNSKAFISMVERIKKDFEADDAEMVRWEKKNGFSHLDCRMKERRLRYIESKVPGSTQLAKYLSGLRSSECLKCGYEVKKERKFDEGVINEFAGKGYATAIKLRKAIEHFKTGFVHLQLYGRKCWTVIVHELAQSFRITEDLFQWNYHTLLKVYDVIEWAQRCAGVCQKSELDRDIRVCYVMLNADKMDYVIEKLKESIGLYPDDLWFKKTFCSFIGVVSAHADGVKMAEEGLSKDPDNLDFLYLRWDHLRNLARYDEKAVFEAHEKFLAVAPPDDRRVPKVYYSMACDQVIECGCSEKPKLGLKERKVRVDTAAKYYKLGLEAEKNQIPCFLPVTCDEKRFLDEMMALKQFKAAVDRQRTTETLKPDVKKTLKKPSKAKRELPKEDPEVLMRKQRLAKLTDPYREGVIREHRHVIKLKPHKRWTLFTANLTFRTKYEQEGPPQLAEVKSITLQEMDPFKEHVYKGFELKCYVIDEPTLGLSGVGIVVEDQNGDVQRACVCNVSQDSTVREKIGYGCKIIILNPYFLIAMDGKAVIRVDDVGSVIFESGPDGSRCRYCGKVGSFLTCGRCNKARYCSKECQVGDWKILRHKFVCGSLLK